MKSWNEIRKAATAFSKRWKNAYDEKSQAQSFLKEFFAVFGVDAVMVATFEHRVKFVSADAGKKYRLKKEADGLYYYPPAGFMLIVR